MSFAGEIRLFAGNVTPTGWAFCHGQPASISSAPRLYEAIGTRFGGDGQTTFALPDLRGRVPVHRSSVIALGAEGGSEVVVLDGDQIPSHQHAIPVGSRSAGYDRPGRRALIGHVVPESGASDSAVSLGESTHTGSSNAHPNLQPFLCLNFIIALEGGSMHGAEPVVGEVRLFSGEAMPAGWTRCDGQLLDIQQFGGLYSVIGTTYGGDGRRAFGLPDLRGRIAMQAGYRQGLTARQLGEAGGSATVDLDADQLPSHVHDLKAVASVEAAQQQGRPLGTVGIARRSGDDREQRPRVPVAMGLAGGDGQHANLQPYLALTYLIAYDGRLPQLD